MTRTRQSSPTTLTGGSFGVTLAFAGGTTFRCGPGNGCNTTVSVGQNIAVPVSAGVIGNLRVHAGTAPGASQSLTFVVEKNAVATLISCTLSGATAVICSDSSHFAAFADDDRVSVGIIPSSASTASTNVTFSLTYQPLP